VDFSDIFKYLENPPHFYFMQDDLT